MLIDATHDEETRVVVLRGHRVEEFDFESASRKQLRGNIYLAKVTRVEPSLQAAFVDYGGNRHGFLAFSEIHPDYYQIPVADRQELLAEEAEAAAAEDHDDDDGDAPARMPVETADHDDRLSEEIDHGDHPHSDEHHDSDGIHPDIAPQIATSNDDDAPVAGAEPAELNDESPGGGANVEELPHHHDQEIVEAVGGADALEEAQERPRRLPSRRYKIQEVIKRRQVLLVQVVKEERGNKGAALTTYLSLAGRYSVLMPNTARGGGISRKITNPLDRRRLKDLVHDLDVPDGMGIILRTAGASRTKPEIKRDYEYLMRLWENVAELTLKSEAPALVYEEGSLVKRSIRDLYDKDIDEVTVSGDAAYREAKDFMRMLMPSHAKNVKAYRDEVPVFTRLGIESQLEQMMQSQVRLPSGGYIVINQTEALVSIDVNSGRSTREHNIEDTAVKTNLEAAEEIARQLRLRDLAGLIVIDFIDMDEGRNNRSVERRLKDHLKRDRARIQVGRISHFGLLEMSRQRIRTSVLESTMEQCPVCAGSGLTRSPSSAALQILRVIEEALIRDPRHDLVLRVPGRVALYVLNTKRANLSALEDRFGVTLTVDVEDHLPSGTNYLIDKAGLSNKTPRPRPTIQVDSVEMDEVTEDEEILADAPGAEVEESHEGDGEASKRRRRRRRRGPDKERTEQTSAVALVAPADGDSEDEEDDGNSEENATGDKDEDRNRKRRRGRRGGRRMRRNGENGEGFEREKRLEPVTWLQPGEEAPNALLADASEPPTPDSAAHEEDFAGHGDVKAELIDTSAEAPAETLAIPLRSEAPAAEAPAAEPPRDAAAVEDAVAPMPRIPDLAEIVEEPQPIASEPTAPRRRGWWSRKS